MMALSTGMVRASLARPVLSKTVARALSTNTSSTLIVNAVGLDRPGIVSDVTKYVTDAGGNVGQSQAAKLGEYFSIMMQIEVPAKEVDDLKNSLTSMSGMNTSIFETEGKPKVSSRPKIAYSGQFELEGASYPGLVHKYTSLLAKHGLSIDTMGTTEEIAPHGGTSLFRMKGIAHAFEPLPKTFDSEQIQEELQELGESLNCDLSLVEVDEDSYSGSFYGS